MQKLKGLQKLVEAINTYYAFALLVYAVVLYIAGHNHLFFWILIAITPLLTGWSGYLLKSFIERRNLRHGFKLLSDVMLYEITNNHKYVLRYKTTIEAGTDHLMVYPIGYRWSGTGEGTTPKITGKDQQLLALFERRNYRSNAVKVIPYKAMVSTDGDWHYWFIALNPPVHKKDIIEIKYTQEFYDKKNLARPFVRYFVRVPMKRLELNVKFPANSPPKALTSSYIKPSDPSRPYVVPGASYDADKLWATWVIEKPKKGYCYQIHWQ